MEIKMATNKTNGNVYSVPPNVKSSGSNNNRGVVARGGSVASGKLTNVGVSRYNSTVFASTVVDNASADKALSSGTFSYQNNKPVAQRLTSTISGVANTTLRSGADIPGQIRGINSRVVYRNRLDTTAFRAGYFNLYTGKYSPTPTVYVDSVGTDEAATVSRSSPGTLAYKGGALNPVQKAYPAKTN
jgi:hypothetical protein